jgi:hypothetical protein
VTENPQGVADTEVVPRRGVEVDALFLANGAEVRDGLTYVLGGGWTRCWASDGKLPHQRQLFVVIMFRVPWDETNRQHSLRVRVLDDDGANLLGEEGGATGSFNKGRQADLHVGASQSLPVALALPVTLEREGIYHVAVDVDEQELKRIDFEFFESTPPSAA